MLNRTHLSIILVLAIASWAGMMWVFGIPLEWKYLTPYAATLTLLSAVVVVFDKWIWNWRIFRGWLVKKPYIQGTWKTKLSSNYKEEKTGKPIKPIMCIMVIRQSYSNLSMRLYTDESSSWLIANSILRNEDDTYDVVGVYQNEPKIHLRGDRSEIHFGSLKLQLNDGPAESMIGHYWTDRGTNGLLELSDRKDATVSTYKEGMVLFKKKI